jgi:uncharacterized protein (TIGR02611 family)
MQFIKKHWRKTPTIIRKPVITIIGVTVLVAGIAMLALPGPGWVTIFLGLAILATEFTLADKAKKSLINKFKQAAQAAKDRLIKP